MGYVIIPKPNFFKPCCRCFDVLLFGSICRPMTAVVAIQVVAIRVIAVPTGRWRSTVTAIVAVPPGRWRFTVTAVVAVPTGRWRSTVTAVVIAQVVAGPLAINHDHSYHPFLTGCWRSTVTAVTAVTGSFNGTLVPRLGFREFFAYKKVLGRTEMQTLSRAEGMSVDTNSLRHLPRQSSNNCCL